MKRILVPVDFSPAMESVLALAREMARAFQAELHLVHVRESGALPVFPAATIGYPGMGMPEMTLGGGIGIVPPLVPGEPPNEKQPSQLEALAQDLHPTRHRSFRAMKAMARWWRKSFALPMTSQLISSSSARMVMARFTISSSAVWPKVF